MPYYKHYFMCTICGKHLVMVSDSDVPSSPGRTHEEALEEAAKMFKNDPDELQCGGLGTVRYCSGSNVKKGGDWTKPGDYVNCTSHSRGTDTIAVHTPSAPPINWTNFAARVKDAWDAFVSSGYSPALRGANNHREYRADSVVSGILRSSGGIVSIGGAAYVISESNTAGVSLKRTIPPAYQVGNIKSFIYHL